MELVSKRLVAYKSICLSFKEFFKRKPWRGTVERIISFSERELGWIARKVWIERMW